MFNTFANPHQHVLQQAAAGAMFLGGRLQKEKHQVDKSRSKAFQHFIQNQDEDLKKSQPANNSGLLA